MLLTKDLFASRYPKSLVPEFHRGIPEWFEIGLIPRRRNLFVEEGFMQRLRGHEREFRTSGCPLFANSS